MKQPVIDSLNRLCWWPLVIAFPENVQSITLGAEATEAALGYVIKHEDICAIQVNGMFWVAEISATDALKLMQTWGWHRAAR